MVLYRKYRPQTIEELDSVSVRQRLQAVLSSEYIPHAFLFSGTKGAGKTSSARILAKFFTCERSKFGQGTIQWEEIKPCNACDACVAVEAGNNLDVIEIDAASNRGIDEIRQLRENIKLSPVAGKMKVYIIDEVHMLTNEAFNALLKTLEEPPAHAVFILATTEPEKVPETIRSRSTHIIFPKATAQEVRHALERVIAGENVTVPEAILDQIAHVSDGAFRDATKLLEQILAEHITDIAQAEKILGSRSTDIGSFFQLLVKKDTRALLQLVESLQQNGADIRGFTSQLLATAHDMLLSQHGLSAEGVPAGVPIHATQLTTLLKLLSRVYMETKTASSPVIPLEIAIVEWCENPVRHSEEPKVTKNPVGGSG